MKGQIKRLVEYIRKTSMTLAVVDTWSIRGSIFYIPNGQNALGTSVTGGSLVAWPV